MQYPKYWNIQNNGANALRLTCSAYRSYVLFSFAEDFRVLNLGGSNKLNLKEKRKGSRKAPVLPPRANKMPVDQDWPSVWPVARTFHPASVPLPLHQGWVKPGQTPPGKFANPELMKIPNFLHLTPPAIQRQAEALKSTVQHCNHVIHMLFTSLL